jgi:1,4-alpha-glucan branching enzyme
MAGTTVTFEYMTGLKTNLFRNVRLSGSWDVNGRFSSQWTESPMQKIVGPDGCPTFTSTIELDSGDSEKTFRWGVVLDHHQASNVWGITK